MSKRSRLRGPFDTVAIWVTEPLPYLLITVKVFHLEKLSLSAMQNLFVNTLTTDDKYS